MASNEEEVPQEGGQDQEMEQSPAQNQGLDQALEDGRRADEVEGQTDSEGEGDDLVGEKI